jgi:hypothetical protein
MVAPQSNYIGPTREGALRMTEGGELSKARIKNSGQECPLHTINLPSNAVGALAD